jgi:hypothetical protein
MGCAGAVARFPNLGTINWPLSAHEGHSTRSSIGAGESRGENGALRRVAAAAKEAVSGAFVGFVERRRLRPHLVDCGQRPNNRRPAVDRGDPGHQLRIAGSGASKAGHVPD